MTSSLFLIAHKVRGEPAFDVATKMECPECTGDGSTQDGGYIKGCTECDGLGFWWIIPTSGHRAYPWRWWPLVNLRYESHAEVQDYDVVQPMDEIQNGIPDEVPDHYTTHSAPRIDLATALGLRKPAAPVAPIIRRF